ncbi:hypothetical protein [Sphingopyxis sp. A083]|uniref:hypothetical protein n=1 Tax=Sphingopyxis sp. A083 TaxID=1759083 RepID=UPI0012E36141|nr:hypothetical protein [Sphingopyxis sp. A083]
MSLFFSLLLTSAAAATEPSSFSHGAWSGTCGADETDKRTVCQASTTGKIRLFFTRDANEWAVSASVAGCDKPQERQTIDASATKGMLRIGDRAAAQILKSMAHTRLLSAMMSCEIKKYDDSALNDRDLIAIITATNVVDIIE